MTHAMLFPATQALNTVLIHFGFNLRIFILKQEEKVGLDPILEMTVKFLDFYRNYFS